LYNNALCHLEFGDWHRTLWHRTLPPLTIEEDLLQEGLQRLDGVIAKVMSQVGLAATSSAA